MSKNVKIKQKFKELIIHIGPGKCGSSSIQGFIKNKKNKNYYFELLDPVVIKNINDNKILNEYENHFKSIFSKYKKIILSHECLGRCLLCILFICKLAFNNNFKIKIIGYSRTCSSYLQSSYCQWYFRNKWVCKENNKILLENNIMPKIFNGLEIYFIAGVLVNFKKKIIDIISWFKLYKSLKNLVSNYNVIIIPGMIPNSKNKFCLISDFCKKAKIIVNNKEKKNMVRGNKMYNKKLIEATRIANLKGTFNFHPHLNNKFFLESSKILNKKYPNEIDSKFLKYLKSYTDNFFYEDNKKFCNEFNLKPEYFEGTKINFKEIIEIIHNEQTERLKSPLKFDHNIEHEWLLKLIKEKIINNP